MALSWNVSARFSDSEAKKEARVASEIGKQSGVFGKKKAKEVCGGEVLVVLERIGRDRVV
ncbi:hypothetical protein LTR62_006394 [Meristemomyces frigidus]|uniref:Uncharacterized protein n=1 Tax=Meristemomyces frigidus TaxID=1508187 RepID=A0AAN7YEI2_9PEZI|nr:hypothetical protein LTR62_006394 [Meristemomyces frigidus]